MAQIVRCPDCGGIVGATQVSDEGPPCTCFSADAYRAAAGAGSDASGSDASGADLHTPSPGLKICRICGKDLTGKKRMKDRLGYWCPECAEEDAKRNEEHGVKCEKCFRTVPTQAQLTSVDGKMICSRCVREERELRAPGSKKYRVISDNAYKQNEKRSIIIMAVILAVLLVLMAIAWQNRPWAHSRANDAPMRGAVTMKASHLNGLPDPICPACA